MSRRRKTTLLLTAALMAAVLVLSVVYAGSVLADKKGVGQDTEGFALSIGDGPGQIGYVEANGDVDAWGPCSFTVLYNGKVVILDTANQRLLVVNQSGEEVQSIPYAELGLVSPVDLCEWRGRLAIADCSITPEAVILVNLNSRRSEDQIELPDGLAEAFPRFMNTNDGGLQLVLGMSQNHRVADGTSGYDVATIGRAERAIDVPGFGDVVVESGALDGSVGPAVSMTRANDKSAVSRRVSADGVAVQTVQALGCSQAGNLLVKTGYLVPAGDRLLPKGYVEELSKNTLETVASATIPEDEFYLWPERYLSMDHKGRVWCMVAEEDRVSFRILTLASEQPDVADGAIARRIDAFALRIGAVLSDAMKSDQALADAAPGGHTSPWTRAQGKSVASSYFNAYWYCGYEAYDRDCGTTASGPYNNERPAYLTGYNYYTYCIPYAWGKWDTVSSFQTYVNSTGRDAGDASGGTYSDGTPYPTLSCVMGTDCSGLVSRVWGLSTKHGTSNLGVHANLLADSTPLSSMIRMDVFLHPGHVILFDLAVDSDTSYCYEATTDGIDRVTYRARSWYALQHDAKPYHKYRYKYWTG